MRRAGGTLLALALLGGLGLATVGSAFAAASAPVLEQRELQISKPLLFDLGVVDFNGDGALDVFTLNHNDRGSLLANRGDGRFDDRLTAAGLDQAPGFPGWEVPRPAPMGQPGVYINRTHGADPAEGALAITVRAGAGERLTGSVTFLFPVAVRAASGAQASLAIDRRGPVPRHVVEFSTEGDARLVLEPEQMATPIDVAIAEHHPTSAIFVGPLAVRPPQNRFTLWLRDRHGMAWGDYNRDGLLDVMIARGGLKRRVGEFKGLITDELMLGEGSRFRDATAGSGLVKRSCASRQAEPVDVNRDGRLDVFIACKGRAPMLFRQRPNGRFANISRPLARAGVGGESFTWLDLTGDGRQELIAARKRKLFVFTLSRRGRWGRREAVKLRSREPPRAVAVGDLNADGKPDLFAAAPSGNTLVVTRRSRLRALDPGRFGLPKRDSVSVDWVDYDNDGLLDLHLAPQGLFRRIASRRFEGTGLAALPAGTVDAFATWFDSDGSGARDVVAAWAVRDWEATLLANPSRDNHWLQVELTGRRGSYPAIGAKVRVRAGGRTQTQWVGQNDGSRFSQGHYRLYFGLGRAQRAGTVKVTWPDGSSKKLKRVQADQVLRVSFERR